MPRFSLYFVSHINGLMLYILFYRFFNLTPGGNLAMSAAIDVLSSLIFQFITTPQLSHFSMNGPLIVYLFLNYKQWHNEHIYMCHFRNIPSHTHALYCIIKDNSKFVLIHKWTNDE